MSQNAGVSHHVLPLRTCAQIGAYEDRDRSDMSHGMMFGGDVVKSNRRVMMLDQSSNAGAILKALLFELCPNMLREYASATVFVENLIDASG